MAFLVNDVQVAGNGKSAYLYALAGGYTGTEEDFNKALGNINNISGVTEEYVNNTINTAIGAAIHSNY